MGCIDFPKIFLLCIVGYLAKSYLQLGVEGK